MIDFIVGKLPVPDLLLRSGIKYLLSEQKKEVHSNFKDAEIKLKLFAQSLKSMPIAIMTEKANEQHYEVPSEFYQLVLGAKLKYSCGSWKNAKNLNDSEVEMLEDYIIKAQIADNQEILDLGCGWGSFTLFAAKKFPKSHFTAVSNSATQKAFIMKQASDQGLSNINVITQNVALLDLEASSYDRIVSVEMLEHVKNYQVLFKNVSKWLRPEGLFFVHIFTHKDGAYHFEVKGETDWMSKYFFSGGMMPADKLFYHFQDDLKIKEHWKINGQNYQKTSRAWLDNMTTHKKRILEIFEATYGKKEAMKWFRYWRIFFMACEELWGFDKGEEWIVSHYLFSKVE